MNSSGFQSTGPGLGTSAGNGWSAVLERHRVGCLAGLVLLAAAIRLLRWHATAVLFNDGPIFLAVAEAMRDGEWSLALAHPFHPLYPALIALISLVGGAFESLEVAGVAVSVAAGSLAVALLYAFTRSILGPPQAWLAALFLAVHPAAVIYSGDVQSDGLYLALFLAACTLAWTALRNAAPWRALAAGACVGAAYLTRPEGLGVAVGAGVVALWLWRRGHLSLPDAARCTAGLLAGILRTAAPYLVWMRVDDGDWAMTRKKSVGVVAGLRAPPNHGASPIITPLEQGEAVAPQAARVARPKSADRRRPPRENDDEGDDLAVEQIATGSFADRAMVALKDVLHTHLRSLRYELFALILLGAWLGRPKRLRTADVFPLVLIGLYGALLFGLALNVGYVSGRHTLPSMTLAFGYAAAALPLLARALARFGARNAGIAATVLLVVMVGAGLGKALRPDRMDALAEREMAEWLRQQGWSVDGLAARKRRTAYYANARFIRIPSAATPLQLRDSGASHLILTEDDLEQYPLLDQLGRAGVGRRLHRLEAAGYTAALYELPSAG